MADLIDRNASIRFISNIERDDEDRLFTFEELKKMLRDAPAVSRWIPCSERLPEPLQNVIVCTDIKTVTLAWLINDNWYFADTGNGHIEQWGLSDVTHWMAIPNPPEVNSNG